MRARKETTVPRFCSLASESLQTSPWSLLDHPLGHLIVPSIHYSPAQTSLQVINRRTKSAIPPPTRFLAPSPQEALPTGWWSWLPLVLQ